MGVNNAKRVLIVGGGFSGTVTAILLLRSGQAFSITLFERAGRTARGIAYSATSPEILLNVPAARMSPLSDQPSAFIDWAVKNKNHPLLKGKDPKSGDFLPRSLYGAFLEDLLATSLKGNTNASLEIINGAVSSLTRSAAEWRASGDFSGTRTGEFAVLALGNPPPTIPAQLVDLSSDRLINPWNGLELHELRFGDSVICIGSGLTAIDVVVRLSELEFKGKIHLCSRHGLLPNTHVEDPLLAPKSFLDGRKRPLRTLIRELRKGIDTAIATGEPWQPLLDTLRPRHQELWLNFTITERARFVKHLSPYWEVHRHRVAPELGRLVFSLIRQGRLEMHTGSMQRVEEIGDAVSVTIRSRGSEKIETIRGSHVFLCTGPARTVAAWQSPLIENLLHTKVLQQDDLRFGFTISKTALSQNLFLIGSALRGTLWETTAARELAQQALMAAESILASERSELSSPCK